MSRKHLLATRTIATVWLVTFAPLGAACGADGGGAAGSSPSEMGGMDHGTGSRSSGDAEYAFGQPGEPGEATRTVRIAQTDLLRFEPSQVDVKVGDTVRFVITNLGRVPHEFVLGDEEYQEQHATEMAGTDGSLPPDAPNAVALEPNESAEIVWTFTDPGTLLFGCHVAGHYDAGMVGQITVKG